MTFYELLGLAPGASDEEIKAAYRNLAKACHPDLHPGDGSAERRFRQINAAFSFLRDHARRAAYDELLMRESMAAKQLRRMLRTIDFAMALVIIIAVTLVSSGAAMAPAIGGKLSIVTEDHRPNVAALRRKLQEAIARGDTNH